MGKTEKSGLYVHVPFCLRKCPYCAFYSIPSMQLVPSWLKALEKEMDCYRNRFDPFDSIYLGGGTPSVLRLVEIERIMNALFDHFTFAAHTEITIEANPGDLTQAKAKGFRSLGINRVNVGVQSFDDRILAFLGRRHTARQAGEAVDMLRSAGFENVGMDLIYGVSGQDLGAWSDTLHCALSFAPEHLSCYQLTLEAETPFGAMMDQGLITPLPEKEERLWFLETSRFLGKRGFIHYEISNFAREERFSSRHNTKYWNHVPYLGLGPSAHSFLDGSRWWNARSLDTYLEKLSAGKAPIEDSEHLTDEEFLLETVALGLRTSRGIALEILSPGTAGEERISTLEACGLIRQDHSRLSPTRAGFLVADRMPLYLLD